MKQYFKIATTLLAFIALLAPPIIAAEPAPADADAILRGMSAKLAGAKQFRFSATREIDAALVEGRDLPEKAKIDVQVSRPNQLVAHAVSKSGSRRVIADGVKLTVLDEKMNHYGQVPMKTSLDGLVIQLDGNYGFTPPLAEFAVSDPYKGVRQHADQITYLGTGKTGGGFLGIGGVVCHRLELTGTVADAELWIAVGDKLPRKLVATFKQTGQPQVRIAFTDWNLTAPVPATAFTFAPPAGAEKIEMWTKARMQAAN